MATLNSEQRRVLGEIKRIGARRRETPKEVLAAVETGLVENNLTNRRGGDADSSGWRQERRSLYSDPDNLRASINRFFDETSAVEGKYKTAGELAAAVQRPAAQYRSRYGQREAEARSLLGGVAGTAPAPAGGGGGGVTIDAPHLTESFDQAGYDKARRRAIVGQLIAKRNPNSLLLKSGVLSTQAPSEADFKTSSVTTKQEQVGPAGTGQTVRGVVTASVRARGYSDTTAQFIARANAIDAKKLPYQWGGGHGGKVNPNTTGPLDCSGAVSAVLGIDPRVSGQFTKWGKPGKGRITVYANDEHVLMEINGHFFGTSGSNPGGGAGWIPKSALPAGYLNRFTARHIDA